MNKRQKKKHKKRNRHPLTANEKKILKLILYSEQIEETLPYDEFLDEKEPPKELFDKIVEELKERGIYRK